MPAPLGLYTGCPEVSARGQIWTYATPLPNSLHSDVVRCAQPDRNVLNSEVVLGQESHPDSGPTRRRESDVPHYPEDTPVRSVSDAPRTSTVLTVFGRAILVEPIVPYEVVFQKRRIYAGWPQSEDLLRKLDEVYFDQGVYTVIPVIGTLSAVIPSCLSTENRLHTEKPS